MKPAEHEGGFELSLAIVNAYGEQGNVEGVRRQLSEFIDLYRDVPYALTYGYTALIKAYRFQPFVFPPDLLQVLLDLFLGLVYEECPCDCKHAHMQLAFCA